jgi:hypothetical protein
MTLTARAEVGRWGNRLNAGGPPWVRAGVIVAVLVLAFVAAQTCQKSQIRVDKDQAIAKAKATVDFAPKQVHIRMLRQGIKSKPFWIVSLSVPGKREDTIRRLTFVKIDANTGKVDDVTRRR